MTDRERWALLTATDFIRRRVKEIPVDVPAICRDLGVRVIPLSQMIRDGLNAAVVFGIWGNPDGTASLWKGQAAICYNDSMPANRVRFTLAEELMHIVLGHLKDSRFNIFSQDFDDETYAGYEHEAKMCAGMLLCPPRFYFTFERDLNPTWISQICQVSEACALRIVRDYSANEKPIKGFVPYAFSVSPKYDSRRMWWYRAHREGDQYEVL